MTQPAAASFVLWVRTATPTRTLSLVLGTGVAVTVSCAMTCATGVVTTADVLPVWCVSPPYRATIRWVPACSVTLISALPASPTHASARVRSTDPPSRTTTDPVAAAP